MKHIAHTLLMLLSLCFMPGTPANASAISYAERPDYQKLSEKRFQLIVQELKLDSDKEKALRPIYMEYCQKIFEAFQAAPPPKRGVKLSESEIEKNILNRFSSSKKIINVRETYYKKMRKYLSPSQIQRIYDIEQEEIHKIQQSRKHRGGPRH